MKAPELKGLPLAGLTVMAIAVAYFGTLTVRKLHAQSQQASVVPRHSVELETTYKLDGSVAGVRVYDSRYFRDGSIVEKIAIDGKDETVNVNNISLRIGFALDPRTNKANRWTIANNNPVMQPVMKPCVANFPPSGNVAVSLDPTPGVRLGFKVDRITTVMQQGSGAVTHIWEMAPDLGCAVLLKEGYSGATLRARRVAASVEVGDQDMSLLELPPSAQFVSLADWTNSYTSARNAPDQTFRAGHPLANQFPAAGH